MPPPTKGRTLPAVFTAAPKAPYKRKQSAVKSTSTSSAAAATSPTSKRIAVPTSSSASPSLFTGCVILLVPGSDLTSGRRAILTEQVHRRGGSISGQLNEHVTHIVVPSDYPAHKYSSWLTMLSEAQLNKVQVKSVEWIIQSLKRDALQTHPRYDVQWREKLKQQLAESTLPAPPQRELFPEERFVERESVPSSPPFMSQPPPLSPMRSQTPSPLPSPAARPAPPPAAAVKPHEHDEKPQLSIPDSDEEDSPLPRPTDLSSSSTPGQPDYLIDPTLLFQPPTLPLQSAPSPAIMPPHPYYSKDSSKKLLACQTQSVSLVNHNSYITSILERLEEMNNGIGDKWRAYAYRKAVGIVKQFPREIKTQADLEELSRIRGIGDKMKEKIREIMETGQLEKMRHMEADERIQTMERFSKIHGVGAATAGRWYAMGLRTLNDVRTHPDVKLNSQQQVGLKYYEDKQRRIPRAEVEAIEKYVRAVAQSIYPDVEVLACGSYRRGKPSSGDVDLLITHQDFTSDDMGKKRRETFTHQLMDALNAPINPPYPWLSDYPSEHPSDEPLPPFITGTLVPFDRLTRINRRLDVKTYPMEMFPFALMYFTGSDHFNRSLRWYAKKCGWTLSDHGLSPAFRVPKEGKVWVGATVLCKTEKDVFEAMGLTYIPPTERNVWANFDLSEEEVKRMQEAVKKEEEEERLRRETADADDAEVNGVKKEASDGEKGEDEETKEREAEDREPEDFYSL